MSKEHVGYMVTWTEFERGWGCRPDGATLHDSQEEVKRFIKAYWDRMPESAPQEYSSPNDENGKLVKITPALSRRLGKKKSFYLSREEERAVRDINGG